nr:hypothetical protein [Ramlibacter algicola]
MFTALLAGSCGGGGGDDVPVAQAPPAAAIGPAAPAPAPAPAAAPTPPAAVPPPPAAVPAPPTAAPNPPAPAPAGSIAATFVATVFADSPQAGAMSLNDTGQVAYTATTATGERARFFDGAAVRDISAETGRAVALNAAGMVTGFLVRGSPHIFSWLPGPPEVLSVIDTSPSVSTVPAAINTSGQMAGTLADRGFRTGFRRNPDGTGQSLEAIGSGMIVGTEGLFINTAATIAGLSSTPAGGTHAALWVVGQPVVDVGTLGGANSSVAALNDAGQVAGQAELANGQQRAYRWSASQGIVDLGTLGGPDSAAAAMNAAGWVAGSASTADGHTLATLWRDATPLSLGTLGGTDSAATVVNAAGQVGGRASTAGGAHHAFLWSQLDGMVDLNARVGSADVGLLQEIVALAQDGSVLATTDRGTLVLLRPAK